MIEFVRKRLSRKILFALAASAAVFTAAIIYLVVVHQTNDMTREMLISGERMEHMVYAGIKYPMTIGDKKQVERELLEIGATGEDMEIFICDTRQNIIFSSQEKALRSDISKYVSNNAFLQSLDELLKTGQDPETVFEDTIGKTRYIVSAYPLLNEKECHHCHGSLRKVLGSMVVKKNAENNYAAIFNLRTFNIAISITGIIALIILMKILLNRLVQRPLADLTANIKELTAGIPRGDYTARIAAKRPDEIGSLIDSFNHMAETLEQKNNALQKAHIELFDTNKELRLAKKGLEEMNDMLEHRVEERTRELRESEEQVRAFALRLAEAEEHERKLLSQELHDAVGQTLSLLIINLSFILSRTAELPEVVRFRIADAIALVEQATERTRYVMANLRPPVLDDYGLTAALKWYAEKFSLHTGIMVNIDAADIAPRPSFTVENAMFRIAQELLTNVAKHAGATQVSITIGLDGTILRMEIADNGTGFNPSLERMQNKWGLINIKERTESIGGALRINASEGSGTHVIVEVPL